jgi:hypothetical protein
MKYNYLDWLIQRNLHLQEKFTLLCEPEGSAAMSYTELISNQI